MFEGSMPYSLIDGPLKVRQHEQVFGYCKGLNSYQRYNPGFPVQL